MAVKLDMIKAYDRVEWNFVHKILLQFGFHETWVERILRCINSVQFSVLVNNMPTSVFIPSRGLRQGDPLSPYLFILIAEGLSRIIQNKVEEGTISGIQASRGCPKVSHLLFTNDTILFCKAADSEARSVMDILHLYKTASGQVVNENKSEVFFSKGVQAKERARICTILGMKEVRKFQKYLGLPTLKGRTKKELFENLKTRVQHKVNHWNSRLLSQAGREVLIKSIVQAIPTYAMSVF